MDSKVLAYQQWKNLFDENVFGAWNGESEQELKILAMILFSINRETKRIQAKLDKKVTDLKINFLNRKKSHLPKLINNEMSKDKENQEENIKIQKTLNKTQSITQENATVESPELFHMEQAFSVSNLSGSLVIISDEDLANTAKLGDSIVGSPEIKKKKRRHISKKGYKGIGTPQGTPTLSMTFLGENNSDLDCSFEKKLKITDHNLSCNDKSLDFLNEFKGTPQSDNYKCANAQVTSQESDNDFVQCTPVSKSITIPKRKEKVSFLSKKKSRQGKNSTLTQLFYRSKIRKEKISPPEKCYDLTEDLTENEVVHKNLDKDNDTSATMDLTRMISYINKDTENQESIELKSVGEELRPERTDDDKSNKKCHVAKELNKFLAKAQQVGDYQGQAEPVVRGKARQQLPGWSCKDCEKFYINQNLNSQELVALSKCSRHRGYRPREDTLPGFWDMNMITQEKE